MSDTALVARLSRHGIAIPRTLVGEARRAGLPVGLGAAFLMQESAGGHNVFGHDPTICAGWGTVTKPKYLAYKRARGHTRMQGVGPMQLTWWSYQDEADRLGGCWIPACNVRVGFQLADRLIRSYGLFTGVERYNGGGPAAVAYANSVLRQKRFWDAVVAGSIR